jgi:hypothetical protein
VKWEYNLQYRSEEAYGVLENDRHLLSVLHPQDQNGNFLVYAGPFIGCEVSLNPFNLRFPNPGWYSTTTPVFVYQEKPR